VASEPGAGGSADLRVARARPGARPHRAAHAAGRGSPAVGDAAPDDDAGHHSRGPRRHRHHIRTAARAGIGSGAHIDDADHPIAGHPVADHDRTAGSRSSADSDNAAGAGYDGAAASAHHDRTAHHRAADHRVRPTAPAGTAALHGVEVSLIDRALIDRPGIDEPSVRRLADGYWTECRERAMGSTAHVLLGDAPEGVAAWALAEIERLEQCWSRFRRDSELAQLHERAGQWTEVSPPMLLALTCAADLHRATQGRFDPTILAALEHVGYDRSFEGVETDSARLGGGDACLPAVGFDRVEIDIDSARVRIPAGMRIDLGGLGKGLAADLVSRGLIDRGARTALVSLGGDMRARGEPPGGAWQIPVEHPAHQNRVAFVHALRDGALVTSTRRIRAWTRADREYHHIIDPRTGDSTRTQVVAVVAAAAESWWAEGIAKAMMIAGIDDGCALACTARVHAWMYVHDGRVIEASS